MRRSLVHVQEKEREYPQKKDIASSTRASILEIHYPKCRGCSCEHLVPWKTPQEQHLVVLGYSRGFKPSRLSDTGWAEPARKLLRAWLMMRVHL